MTPTPVPATGHLPTQNERSRMPWLDILRAVAVLLVIWDHFAGGPLNALGRTWAPSTFVTSTVFNPLAITQYGGFMGVAIFFLISGYIITIVLQRETAPAFVIRRIFRIFPLLALMIVVVLLTNPPEIAGMSPLQVARTAFDNLTLLNFLRFPQVVLIGVAWTLAVEITFYVVAVLLKPVATFARWKPLFPVALICISALLISTARVFGGGAYFQISVYFIYIPLFAIGSVLALRAHNDIRLRWAWALGILAYAVFLFGTHTFYPQFLAPADSYPVSAIYAIVIFTSVWILRESIPRITALSAIALISYSLYLVHGVIGQPILFWLVGSLGWPFTLAFVTALVLTFAVSTATYFVIEVPANNLARRLTTKKKPKPAIDA